MISTTNLTVITVNNVCYKIHFRSASYIYYHHSHHRRHCQVHIHFGYLDRRQRSFDPPNPNGHQLQSNWHKCFLSPAATALLFCFLHFAFLVGLYPISWNSKNQRERASLVRQLLQLYYANVAVHKPQVVALWLRTIGFVWVCECEYITT